jgi:hypothetical protein
MMNLNLTKDEATIIFQAISYARREDRGFEELKPLLTLGKERVEEIFKLVDEYFVPINEAVNFNLSPQDLEDLILIYDMSCVVFDPIELPTVTGYSWDFSQEVSKNLRKILQEKF